MYEYINRLKTTIKDRELISPGDKIVVGLSGGVDSVALLAMLEEVTDAYSLSLYPIYIHHNIRKAANADVDFCLELCERLGLSCKIEYVDVPSRVKESKRSEEEVARNLRYEALRNFKKELEADCIAIAHHKEDQAETIIHRFLRGAGSLGLIGMAYRNKDVIRPLLNFSKDQLIDYVNHKQLSHITDETNTNTQYTRNKIRHELLPYLKEEFNPNLTNSLVRLSGILSEDEKYMENEALKVLKIVSGIDHTLNTELLLQYPKAIIRRVIRLNIFNYKGDLKNIEYSHIERVYNLLSKQSGKRVTLCEDIIVLKEFNILKYIRENTMDKSFDGFSINLDTVPIKGYIEEANIGFSIRQIEQLEYKELTNYKDSFKISQNVYTKCFDYDKIKANLVLRSREPGDYIQIHKDGGTKTIKKVFVDKKVPGSKRNTIPLLADGNEIIWAVGLRDNPAYAVSVESKNIIVVELTKEDKHAKY